MLFPAVLKATLIPLLNGDSTMAEIVAIELPESVALSARVVAARTSRPIEEVLVSWLARAAAELPISALPDEQVLALRDLQMADEQQQELSALLAGQREQQLDAPERARLDWLLTSYRRGMVRKAQALQVAVDRGLQPPLS